MTYRPRIHCLIPNPSDATSLYRATGPLSKLKYHIDCEFNFNTNVSWDSLAWADILFVQRPWGDSFKKACEIAINNNVPIWIDYDDYLLDVPSYNPHRKHFSNHNDQQQMIKMLEMATCITVTTHKLKEKFSKHNDNVFIIPNALDDYTFKFEYTPSKNKLINWRGSNTHSEDLNYIIPKIKELQDSKKYLDWTWNFIGKDAQNLKSKGIHYKYQSPLDPIEYFHYIKDLNPAIQLVPLIHNEFNEAKSNIGWLEGIYSGAVCISPKSLREFNVPGSLLYETEEDFKNIMDVALSNPKYLNEFYESGYEFIKENLLLSKINIMRKQIVEQLIELRR
jgi:hypothetical protein